MFTRAEVTYAWPRPDGSAGSDREPVAVFTGEAVHAHLGHLPDQDIEAMLNDLAVELGSSLGQERLNATGPGFSMPASAKGSGDLARISFFLNSASVPESPYMKVWIAMMRRRNG